MTHTIVRLNPGQTPTVVNSNADRSRGINHHIQAWADTIGADILVLDNLWFNSSVVELWYGGDWGEPASFVKWIKPSQLGPLTEAWLNSWRTNRQNRQETALHLDYALGNLADWEYELLAPLDTDAPIFGALCLTYRGARR